LPMGELCTGESSEIGPRGRIGGNRKGGGGGEQLSKVQR
jgi:hypothetical protein